MTDRVEALRLMTTFWKYLMKSLTSASVCVCSSPEGVNIDSSSNRQNWKWNQTTLSRRSSEQTGSFSVRILNQTRFREQWRSVIHPEKDCWLKELLTFPSLLLLLPPLHRMLSQIITCRLSGPLQPHVCRADGGGGFRLFANYPPCSLWRPPEDGAQVRGCVPEAVCTLTVLSLLRSPVWVWQLPSLSFTGLTPGRRPC